MLVQFEVCVWPMMLWECELICLTDILPALFWGNQRAWRGMSAPATPAQVLGSSDLSSDRMFRNSIGLMHKAWSRKQTVPKGKSLAQD